MKQNAPNIKIVSLRICITVVILTVLSVLLFSFSVDKFYEDLFSQLGIEKTEADKKITNSILGGYLDAYGLKNVKQIALGNRAVVASRTMDN